MKILQNYSLKNHNTFGIDAIAKEFVVINSIEELKEAIAYNPSFFVLGGGSNVLFSKYKIPFVIQINIKGIETISQSSNEVEVKVAAGENWHEFVLWCVRQNYGGIENLALIPGNVGACPIQNIGAYGVEVKDCIVSVETLEIETLKEHNFKNSECNFDYRDSIFKNQLKGKHIITAVVFKLSTKNHTLNLDYGAITDILNQKNINNPTLSDVADTVINIRQSKLPNPSIIGNGGSFFKNPVISKEHFNRLQKQHPTIPFYTISESSIKIPAGWLIEKAGLKGHREGDAGVHKLQALVLVNYGNASGLDIISLAKKIQKIVKDSFQITLEIEVNLV